MTEKPATGRVVTGEEVPQDVLDAAQRGYSMHGAGLTANIVAAAWPAIEKHIRDRTPTGDLRERLADAMAHAPGTVYQACNDDMYLRLAEAERKLQQALEAIADERRGRLAAEAAVRRAREKDGT